MTTINPARFKPALYALVAGTFVLATGCSSSGGSTQAAGGAAVSQLEAATGGSISGDCVSGNSQGASATVCADGNGDASVKATVDEGSGASINASSDDSSDESADVTTSDDEDTDASTAAGGGSGTTTKPAAAPTGRCAAGFPLPSGAVVVTCSDEAASVDLVATVSDPEGAYQFYLDALPKAGYKITDKESANLAGVYGATITFSGGDFTGADTSVVLTDIGTGGLTVHLAR